MNGIYLDDSGYESWNSYQNKVAKLKQLDAEIKRLKKKSYIDTSVLESMIKRRNEFAKSF